MKNVREALGKNRSAVAGQMHISPLALSYIEEGMGNPRMDLFERFCKAVNIRLNFLLATDVPVNGDTIAKYGMLNLSDYISSEVSTERPMPAKRGSKGPAIS